MNWDQVIAESAKFGFGALISFVVLFFAGKAIRQLFTRYDELNRQYREDALRMTQVIQTNTAATERQTEAFEALSEANTSAIQNLGEIIKAQRRGR